MYELDKLQYFANFKRGNSFAKNYSRRFLKPSIVYGKRD